MFLQVSVCPHRGACVVLFGGRVWFYSAGDVRGFICGGRAWFYSGGMRGFIQGGVCGFIRGHVWFYSGVHGFIWGACVVLFGGCVWFFWGGLHGFFSFFGYNEIRSMSGWYASYWNAFLLPSRLTTFTLIAVRTSVFK